jgi:hypothetical protein
VAVAIPNHLVVKIAQLRIAFIFLEAEVFPKNFLYWACPDAQHAFRHPMFAEPSKVRRLPGLLWRGWKLTLMEGS